MSHLLTILLLGAFCMCSYVVILVVRILLERCDLLQTKLSLARLAGRVQASYSSRQATLLRCEQSNTTEACLQLHAVRHQLQVGTTLLSLLRRKLWSNRKRAARARRALLRRAPLTSQQQQVTTVAHTCSPTGSAPPTPASTPDFLTTSETLPKYDHHAEADMTPSTPTTSPLDTPATLHTTTSHPTPSPSSGGCSYANSTPPSRTASCHSSASCASTPSTSTSTPSECCEPWCCCDSCSAFSSLASSRASSPTASPSGPSPASSQRCTATDCSSESPSSSPSPPSSSPCPAALPPWTAVFDLTARGDGLCLIQVTPRLHKDPCYPQSTDSDTSTPTITTKPDMKTTCWESLPLLPTSTHASSAPCSLSSSFSSSCAVPSRPSSSSSSSSSSRCLPLLSHLRPPPKGCMHMPGPCLDTGLMRPEVWSGLGKTGAVGPKYDVLP